MPVDSWVEWAGEVSPFAMRPYGDSAVWVGYAPAETGDSAGVLIVAPPQLPGGKFRVLERHQFRGMDFAQQAAFIQKMTQRYWATYIGIDGTGMGTGVAQLVRQVFPGLTTFSYSPEVKTWLVHARPATPIWHGRCCTPCRTNRSKAAPPPAAPWRFSDDRYRPGRCHRAGRAHRSVYLRLADAGAGIAASPTTSNAGAPGATTSRRSVCRVCRAPSGPIRTCRAA